MKKILTSLALVASGLAFAQVGINAGKTSEGATHKLAPDAVFHVENRKGENKGVLLPQVSLSSKTDQETTSGGDVSKGLMVWNTGDGGLKPAGYYYWDGSQWILTGNVGGNSETTNLDFVKGSINPVDGDIPSTSWDNNIFTVIGTGEARAVVLPNPGGKNKGRIISFRNQSSSLRNYNGKYQPKNNTTIEAGSGHLLQSDGNNWYVIAGF